MIYGYKNKKLVYTLQDSQTNKALMLKIKKEVDEINSDNADVDKILNLAIPDGPEVKTATLTAKKEKQTRKSSKKNRQV
jgi:hypothetical protein